MFSDKVFEEIIEAWQADQNHAHRGRRKKPIPEKRDLKQILETTFLASLKKEEGREIKVDLALLAQEDAEEERRLTGLHPLTISLQEPLSLTVDSVIKLAAALDPTTSSLVVAPVDKGSNRYAIWGFMLFGSKPNAFTHIPAGTNLSTSAPDVMMVRARSAGSLLITRGDSQIGRFSNGRFLRATPDPFYSRAMGNYILATIREHLGFKKHDNPYWYVYRDTLDVLLEEATSRGHGGTIVVIPEQNIEEARKYFSPRYSFAENISLEPIILDKLFGDHLSEIVKLSIRKSYLERIRFLAQLSCIDGSLILSDRLRILSFGSILHAPAWRGTVTTGPDGFGGGGAIFEAAKLGTKHNSAINFVGACPGSFAFVISQDGPIRGLIKKNDETVLCWPDCTVSMFAK